jgi:hypothetical protein
MPAFAATDPDLTALRRTFGFPAGYFAAGLTCPATSDDYARLCGEAGLATLSALSRPGSLPPLLISPVCPGRAWPATGPVAALWRRARRHPVSRDALQAACAAAAATPWPGYQGASADALVEDLLAAGLFIAWPCVFDNARWDWTDLYVAPGPRPGAPPWYFVGPDLAAMPLSSHAHLLAPRFLLPASLWSRWVDAYRAFLRAAWTALAPRFAASDCPALPPFLPYEALRAEAARHAAAAGVSLPTEDTVAAHVPTLDASALLERHLPRLLRGGAWVFAFRDEAAADAAADSDAVSAPRFS